MATSGYNIEEPIYGTNAHNVTVKPLDFEAEGSPTTKTLHGLTIAAGGKVVGRISSWNPQPYQRAGTHVYELSYHTYGRPVDFVPGRSEGYTASLTRSEVWNGEIERALGFGAVFDDLADQDRPWVTDEYLFRGANGNNNIYRWLQYTGCWFTNRNEDAYTSDGEAVIRVNAEISYVSRRTLAPS
jgi:hypothetical protein